MPLTPTDINFICARYEERREDFEQLAIDINAAVASALRPRGVKHMVTQRAKGTGSLNRKLTLMNSREPLNPSDFEPWFSPPLKDLAAARVLVYLDDEVEAVTRAIIDHFEQAGHRINPKDLRTKDRYSAYHAHIDCSGSALDTPLPKHTTFELQVCTITSHLWNELEHDIKYKQDGGKPDEAQEELLIALRGSLDLAAGTADRLMRLTAKRIGQNQAEIRDAEGLRYALRDCTGSERLPEGDHESLFDLLSGLMSPLSRANLHSCLQSGLSLERARQLLDRHDEDGNYKDVGCIVLRLLPNFGRSVLDDFIASLDAPKPLLKFVRRALPDVFTFGA